MLFRSWADYALGNVAGRSAAEMAAHRAACPACMAMHAEWRALTAGWPAGGAAAAGSPSGAVRDSGAAVLPERRRRSLVRAVRFAGIRRRWLRPRTFLPAFGVAAAALLVFLLVRTAHPIDPIGAYMLEREPDAQAVLAAPDTTQFKVVPAFGLPGEGFVWLSGDAAEALLYLDGLPELEAADYQAWAVRDGRSGSLGLLTVADGKAHLHVRSALLKRADNISLSAEPKGGSAQPTSAPTALVLFETGR